MNIYLVLGVFAMAALVNSQCIPPCAGTPIYSPGCGCGCGSPVLAPAPVVASPTVIQANSVAASLADTLSLLTVSSLLAETLPYGCPYCSPPIYPGGGCGCGYGYLL